MTQRLTVERLPGPEALEDVAAEWELIDRETSPRTPFTSPAWILAWWKHFPRRRQTLFNDEFYCHVVRAPGGRLVAIAPLMRTFSPGFGPPVLRMVQFFGTDPALTEVRGLICRPKDEAAAVEALVEHFLTRRDEWDVFRWAGLGEAAELLLRGAAAVLLHPERRFAGLYRRPAQFLGAPARAHLLQHAQEAA